MSEATPSEKSERHVDGARLGRSMSLFSVLFVGVVLANNVVLLVPPMLLFLGLQLWRLGAVVSSVVLALRTLVSPGPRARPLLWFGFASALAIASPMVVWRAGWPLRRLAFARACSQAQVIDAAIARYTEAHQEPPASLDALVPAFLPSVLWSRLPAFPRFEYARNRTKNGELIWYDLGDRSGRPMAGLWVYPDGPGSHAILVLTLDERGALVSAHVDRLPAGILAAPFDGARWQASRTDRMAMAPGLSRDKRIAAGTTRAQLTQTLGEPDGRRELIGAPWELWLSTPTGFINFDGLLYFPTHRYPERTHGGTTEPIGACAYVHD